MNTITSFFLPRPQASCRLFCLHHVGGSMSYYTSWLKLFPDFIEPVFLELPGRNATWQESPITQWPEAIDRIVHTIESLPNANIKPIILFGHSLGALLSFEVAHKLQNAADLRLLLVSGMSAPQHYHVAHLRYTLGDQALLDYIANSDEGTANKDENYYSYLRHLLPTIRADFKLVDTYRYTHSTLLSCPLNVMGANADQLYPTPTLLEWKEVTTGVCEYHFFNGGHMYLATNKQEVIEYISNQIHLYCHQLDRHSRVGGNPSSMASNPDGFPPTRE